MEPESHSNSKESDVQDKQEHIKQRLKDLGVSEDSERPKKNWFKQYGNYFLIIIVALLVVAYWAEYKNQDDHSVKKMAKESTSVKQTEHLSIPSSQAEHKIPLNNQKFSWEQYNAIQQKRMQQAWEQQKIRQQAWRKQVTERRKKDWLAWQQWLKQQQALRQTYGASKENRTAYNRNPNYARGYPFRSGHMQGSSNGVNQSRRDPYNMPNPPYYQVPPNYPRPYYNGRQWY